MKNKQYHTVGTIPKSNIKSWIEATSKSLTQIHDRSLVIWTKTYHIQTLKYKFGIWVKASPLSEMM
jgi:hypothetical protein